MLDPREAAAALKDADAITQRSAAAYSYSQSAPYCFIWGAVWFLGYGAEALAPLAHPAWLWLGWWWLGLSLIGAAASLLVGRRQAIRRDASNWRVGVLFLIIWLFTLALFAVLHPAGSRQVGAYFPLLFSAIYTAIGLWLGLRYIVVGIAMAVGTLFGFFWLGPWFFLWMAMVGGLALVLTGLWLRKP